MITPVSTILASAVPHPVRIPPRTPDAPLSCCFFCSGRECGWRKRVVAVIRHRIRGWVLIQVNDLAMDCGLCRARAGHIHINGHILRLIRCGPAHPGQLGVSVRVVDVADRIGGPIDVEPHSDWIIRVTLPAADLHRRNDLCVSPVLVVIGGDDWLLRLLLEPDDSKAKGRLDVGVACFCVCRAGPCRISKIRRFQEHSQRQILVRQAPHPCPQMTANNFII